MPPTTAPTSLTSRIPPDELRAWASGFKYFPTEFANRVVPFGQAGTEWESWKGLWPWQERLLESIAAEMRKKNWGVLEDGNVVDKMPIQRGVRSCAGSGKTSFFLPFVMFWLMTVLPGIRAIMISTTREQLMDRLFKNVKVLWEASPELSAIFDLSESGKVWRKDMPNTSYATFRTAEKPEGMSGLHSHSGLTLVCFDESSGVSEAMWEATSGARDDPQAIIIAVGNPYRAEGWFHRIHSGDLAEDWQPVHIARWDLPNWNEDKRPFLIRQHAGEDTISYRAYVAGEPPSYADTEFISAETVEESMRRKMKGEDGYRVVPETTPLVCGLDVAKGGSSYTCASFVAGMDGRIPPVMVRGSDLKPKDRADWYIQLLMTPRPPYGVPCVVYFDATADNGQLLWELERRGYAGKFIPVNNAHRRKASLWANRRAELWGGFKWWLESGGMLPRDVKLAQTILAARTDMTPQGRQDICPKEEIAKGPAGRSRLDRLDSIMLACLQPPMDADGVGESSTAVRVPDRNRMRGGSETWMG